VSLWIHDGQEAAFEAFERDTARLMAGFGGRIDQAVRMTPSPDGPFEVHVVSFPYRAAFEAYRALPGAQALASRRAAIIRRTESSEGRAVGPYRD
jgi:hypothetical protein